MSISIDELTKEELVKAIQRAHDGMHSEYMSCPWCTGHIGYESEGHDDYCIWLKIMSLKVSDHVR